MLSALTGDDRFERIVNERINGERRPNNMCEILDEIEEKGRMEGRKLGILEVLSGLVNDGLLSITEAAKRAGMSVPKFKEESGLNKK